MEKELFSLPQLNDVTNLGQIDSGGYKKVFRIRTGGRDEALKAIRLFDANIEDPESRENLRNTLLARAQREYQLLQNLTCNNIVRLGSIPAFESDIDGKPYFVYSEEFLDGSLLASQIPNESTPLPSWESIQLLFSTGLNVLEELDSINAVNRDIKPQNIMALSDSSRPFVFFDLGAAFVANSSSITTTFSSAPITFRYSSPEAFSYKETPLDIRSDIFSFAITIYEYATGKHPFIKDDETDVRHQIMNNDCASLCQHRNDIPADFEDMLNQCLKKRLAIRPNLDVLKSRFESLQKGDCE